MAGRQMLRRLWPVLRSGLRLTPAIRQTHLPRQAVIGQNLAARLSGARPLCTAADDPQIINIQDEDDFKKFVIDSVLPVVVDFHASWCGPCKLLEPRLESIIAKAAGKVVMARVDIDENMEIAMKYNVESVPTVYGVKDGKIVQSFIGLKDDDEINSFVQGLATTPAKAN